LLLTRALADETARIELDRELRARAAMGEERAAIARDMHDVVAHTMAIMVVQAGAARKVLDRDPDAALRALATVEDTGRTAMVELRRMLGFLREDEAGDREPQPSLDALGDLLRRSRAAGLPVELRTEGEPRPLPQAASLTAYRVVQEALTNTLKHAGEGARATVTIRWSEHQLAIDVVDNGHGVGRPQGGGHGLVGMRERAALHGGEVAAGPGEGGGFAVSVRLPLATAVAA
jgi:signal transduction histidine kinase